MKLTIILFAVLLLVTCKKDNKYVLNGSFSGTQKEEWIYLVKYLGFYNDRDSAKIENGKFKFEGKIDVPEACAVHYRMDKVIGVATVFIEPGNLNMIIDLENWRINSRVAGGKANEEFYNFESERNEKFVNPIKILEERRTYAQTFEEKLILDSIRNLQIANDQFEFNYVKNNLNSPVALYIFSRLYNKLTLDEKKQILSNLKSDLHNTTIYKSIMEDFKVQLGLSKKSFMMKQNEDYKVVEIELENKPLLQKIVNENPNKVLYVDIWATWCGPCRKEFKFSRKLYNEIDTSKIDMIFLCSDSKKDDWEKMIKDENLPGQHYLIDNDMIQILQNEYEIEMNGIPHYLILGKDGEIKYKSAPRPSSAETLKILNELID